MHTVRMKSRVSDGKFVISHLLLRYVFFSNLKWWWIFLLTNFHYFLPVHLFFLPLMSVVETSILISLSFEFSMGCKMSLGFNKILEISILLTFAMWLPEAVWWQRVLKKGLLLFIHPIYHSLHKVLLYSTGNYIQYPVIGRNGKEYFKKNVYTCITESLCYTAEIDTTL